MFIRKPFLYWGSQVKSVYLQPILASSFVVSLVSFGALAAMLLLQGGAGPALPPWLPAAVLALPVAAYAAAVSPLPTVMMAEMFNFRVSSSKPPNT